MSGKVREFTQAFIDQRKRAAAIVLGTSVALLLAFIAHTFGISLDLNIALRGFSIIELMEAHANPEAFARDYPGGARVTTAASPIAYVYVFLHESFGIDGMVLNYAMILLEICTLAAGSYLLWTTLARSEVLAGKGSGAHSGWAFVCLLLVLLVGDAQRPNLANFGFPFFHGQFYGFADGLRLACIALLLRRRWALTALAFTLCFAIHPIKAAVAMAFAVPLLLLDWRAALNWRCLLSVVATLIAAACWYLLTLSHEGTRVQLQDFLDYTRTLQSHWYPVDQGYFGERHDAIMSPFLALVLTAVVALGHTGWPAATKRKLALGIAVLLCLTGVGIWASVDMTSATLIRICLIRASTLITLLAPFIILAAALECSRNGNKTMAAAFLGFIWVAFLSVESMAPAFAIAITLMSFRRNSRYSNITLALAGVITLASGWLWVSFPRVGDPITAAVPAALAFGLFWLALAPLPALFVRWVKVPIDGAVARMLVLALFFGGGVSWTSDRVARAARTQDFAAAYLDTQLWAREVTPPGSLFMVDPCRWYGWRDFSGRASIGTVREWFMTAWIYVDDARQLEKGKRISSALGFDMEPFRASPNSVGDLCASARAAYYRPDLRGQKAIAKEFGVDYFVFEKRHAKDSLDALARHFAFENAHFAVLASEDLGR